MIDMQQAPALHDSRTRSTQAPPCRYLYDKLGYSSVFGASAKHSLVACMHWLRTTQAEGKGAPEVWKALCRDGKTARLANVTRERVLVSLARARVLELQPAIGEANVARQAADLPGWINFGNR